MTARDASRSHPPEDGRRDGPGDEFSSVFRELLEAATRQGLLKKELATACGMRADYFSHLLSGRRRPTHRETVQRIAAGLDLDDKSSQRLMRAAGFADDLADALPGSTEIVADRSARAGPRHVPSKSGATRYGVGMWCDAGLRSQLSWEEWKLLVSQGFRRTYQTGERLIAEGEADSRVFVLVDGRVKVTCTEADGTEVLLAIRGPGDLVGDDAALDGGLRSATVTALRPSTVRVLSASDFIRFIRDHELEFALLRLAAARQRESQAIRVELSALPVLRRLVRMLLRLSEFFPDRSAGPVTLDLGIPNEELALAIGASRSQVAVHMGWLRREGVVSTGRRRIILLDADRLRAIDAGQLV